VRALEHALEPIDVARKVRPRHLDERTFLVAVAAIAREPSSRDDGTACVITPGVYHLVHGERIAERGTDRARIDVCRHDDGNL
jgi:hypothetical protein